MTCVILIFIERRSRSFRRSEEAFGDKPASDLYLQTALLQPTCTRASSDALASSAMAPPETLWLSPTSLAKVDNDNYRAFFIDKAHLPHPENQSGPKRPRR